MTCAAEFHRLTQDLVVRVSEISSYELVTAAQGETYAKTRLVLYARSGVQHELVHESTYQPRLDVYEVKRRLDERLGVGRG